MAGGGLLASPWLAKAAFAEDDPERDASRVMTPATDKAINQGLKYLAGRQDSEGAFGTGGYSRNVAICSLAGLAFLSGGSTPGRGPYGTEVERCVNFVLKNSNMEKPEDSGFISAPGAASHGPMYGHGFATLFLAEAYGMTHREDMRLKLSGAINLIIRTQNKDGGWRYAPQPRDADLSVTVCQIMALRAARNAGINVPNETVERCIEYVKKCQNADGGFRYMLPGGQSAFPRSAAGIVALTSAGVYDGTELKRALAYLLRHLPKAGRVSRESHYFYGHYYAVQAMWYAGGEYWEKWYPAIRDELIAMQRSDGSWSDTICREYGTAMACVIMQIPNNLLPIFQR